VLVVGGPAHLHADPHGIAVTGTCGLLAHLAFHDRSGVGCAVSARVVMRRGQCRSPHRGGEAAWRSPCPGLPRPGTGWRCQAVMRAASTVTACWRCWLVIGWVSIRSTWTCPGRPPGWSLERGMTVRAPRLPPPCRHYRNRVLRRVFDATGPASSLTVEKSPLAAGLSRARRKDARGPHAPGERRTRAGRGFSRRAQRARHKFALCATTTVASAERPAESASGGRTDLPGGAAATATISHNCSPWWRRTRSHASSIPSASCLIAFVCAVRRHRLRS
jgi:hypothetical protein